MTNSKAYDWTRFTLKIFVGASQSKVFNAWLDDRQITKWFPSKARHDPRKGGAFHWEWPVGASYEGEFLSIKKNQSIKFTFGNKGEEVEVKFHRYGSGTVCEIRQYNMKTGPKDRWEMHRGCLQGWTFFLANLKSFLENKKDLRSKDKKQNYKKDFING